MTEAVDETLHSKAIRVGFVVGVEPSLDEFVRDQPAKRLPLILGEATFPRHFEQRKRRRIAPCDDFAKEGVLLGCQLLSHGSDVKDDRYRAVVHHLHDHPRAEDARLDRDA